MTKDKSLHLTPKQLGLDGNPMIHDADPLASDKGDTNEPPRPLVVISNTYVKAWDHHVLKDGAEAILASLGNAGYAIIKETDRAAMQEKAWKYDQLCK